ncbi:MAG TPA: aminotransferase class III-fold pyridoxal phosphate-dependent enzyme [Bryobacteraceae bacterium]|nr:aminotransferase class III-fold pyridoxal phosphate-dependent enzyme [Bryobacteraceae bacterium]HOL73585.1 aminotransferase class III-fold pyridoxal phosphate-dependent enzyme [Bryobacteraceae bacterium]HOQ46510.1 aminotransferase class III-fold pyridoxal phosphate-dependent enzyme [Bryobacteraceae bacterium]HPQ14205.1 aminotransferase class III-fold pyridoxal phosphate-dependent enzyme [Bryobacteraceae bacterium]HPU72668.1 aminotransferase class III-fold pyridoxal phosphate-dependent enzyme
MKLDPRREQLLKRTFIDFHQMSEFVRNPLIIDRAEGLYYWDIEGKRYFDAIGGIFVASLGHGHPRVMEAMRKQMERMTFAPPLHGISDVTLDFIEKLGSITPGNLNYVKPFSGGSESTEAAMKFVRQYFKQTGHPHKYKFISRYYGYHGGTAGAMAASGTGSRKSKFEPHMAGFLKVFPPTYYRDRFSSWEECNRFTAQSIEDIIIHEDPETVAGVMVEPIGNTGGIITPTDEYFQIIRDICTKYNVALIFDEVITGFGKTGNMFAAQTFGVTPDIICCGKGMSSGAMPIGAMIAREDMAEAFWGEPEKNIQFAHGHTFAGNPLAAAVGIAVIDEIVENGLDKKAAVNGEYLANKLECLKKYGVVREVRGKGILRGVELTDAAIGTALKRTSLKNGIILRVDPTWFAVSPALIATQADLDEMCALIEKSLVEAIEESRKA